MFRSNCLLYPRVPKRPILDLSIKAPPLDVLRQDPPKKSPQTEPKYYSVPDLVGHRSISNTEKPQYGPEKKYFQITLMRGLIGLPKSTRKVVHTLGLTKRHQIVWKPISSSIAGMILKIKELVSVDCVSGIPPKKKVADGYVKIGNAIGMF